MKNVALVLTVVNAILLVFACRAQIAPASAQDAPPVLRGRSLEIVDDQGRVRASIKIEPPVTMNGKSYAETSILRLIDPNGRPAVKLAGAVDGAGLSVMGGGQGAYVVLSGVGGETSLKLLNKDGRERVIAP
jgi:hypothetical protein